MEWLWWGMLLSAAGIAFWLAASPRGPVPRRGQGGDTRYLRSPPKTPRTIRFATYNISGGRDPEGAPNLERVADELEGADLIALQEVHDSWSRPGQLRFLSRRLSMTMLETPTRRTLFRNQRSNALLSRLPLGRWASLPLAHQHGRHEHFRAVTLCEVETGTRLMVLFTHLNTARGTDAPGGKDDQLREILERFLEHSPAILMGDLNIGTTDPAIRELLKRSDVVDALDGLGPSARKQKKRRDWILCRGVEVQGAGCTDNGTSDHPVYWCDARLPVPEEDAGVAPAPAREAAPLPAGEPAAHVARTRDRGHPWQPWRRAGIRNGILGIGLLAAFLGTASPLSIALGALPLLCGALLVYQARCHLERLDAPLVSSGPYRWVRHPVYLGNAAVDMGLAVMSGWWPLVAFAPLWWLLVHVPLIRREEVRLHERFGQAWRHYAHAVPALVPRWFPEEPLTGSEAGSPARLRQLGRLMRLVSLPLFFLAAWRFGVLGAGLVPPTTIPDALLLAAVPGMMLWVAAWNRHFLDGRSILPAASQNLEARLLLLATVIGVGLVHAALETEFYHWYHWLPGVALLAGSFLALFLYRNRHFMAEALLAGGIAALLEVEWFIPLMVPVYLALALDEPLHARKRQPPLFTRQAYLGSLSLGVTVALFVEVMVPFYQ